MGKYALRRLLYGALVVLLITVFVFAMLRLIPGSPVLVQLANTPGVTQKQVDQLAAQFGLNRPLHAQLFTFFWDAFHGDLGRSFETQQPVLSVIADPLPVTLQLGAMAIVIGVAAGLPLGFLAAVRPNTWLDQASRGISVAGISIPNFWLGLLLVTLLAVVFGWSPPLAYASLTEAPLVNLRQMIIPALALSALTMANVGRLLRSSLLEVLHSNFVRTVRAKGGSERLVLFKHAARNSLVPVFSIIGLQAATIFSGTVILEIIFSVPGMGRLIFDSVQQRDYPVVLGCVVVYGTVLVLINLVVDLFYAVIDPRIRYR